MKMNKILVILSLCSLCFSQNLVLLSPSDFVQTFSNSKIKVISSPIGFKPKSGTLHGKIALASPLSACTEVQPVGDAEDEQDIFLLADDSQCLQSVKAQNLGTSGAYIGIIKRNLSNTLHDRQINVAHIPILQIQPNDYDRIVNYISKNPQATISVLADFNSQIQVKKINMELWLSPTQQKAYQYILEFQNFIANQPQKIGFYPRYVLHSQANRKQYIGCYSSGRFCPSQLEFEGTPEGKKIVGQSLRQIIIASKSIKNWFNYAYNFYQKCLKNMSENLWQEQNIQICSQNSMMSSGIKSQQIFNQFNKSFQGSRPQVDSNIYLEQQRQLYIQQKITKFPILIINGKQYALEDPQQMKIRICTMIHPDPTQQTFQCQTLTNPPLFTTGEICIGIGLFLVLMVAIMFFCKQVIYKRMKKQMKSQVDKTLSQYYRYMETFEQPNPPTGKVPLIEQKIETTQIGSVQLSQIKPNK